jgi:predicted PurR-regulated permease PerM
MLSSVGSVVTSFASSTVVTVGWSFFVIGVSYFILIETEGIPGRIINIRIPGYQADLYRMGQELNRIWNGFLRGQVLLMGITLVMFVIILGGMGVRFYLGLALLAAVARLVPYVGPAVAWTTYGLVAFFQTQTVFDFPPIGYALMVVVVSLIVDSVIDSLITPRVLGDALRVHPAAVMVAAMVSASLFGVLGIIVAAPVLATLILVGRYVMRKSLDLDPWQGMGEATPQGISFQLTMIKDWGGRIKGFIQRQIAKRDNKRTEARKNDEDEL